MKILVYGGVLIVAIAAVIAVCYIIVTLNARGRTFDSVADVPHRSIALMPATSPVTPSGKQNTHFANRIEAAAELFAAGKIDTLIASGGDYRTTERFGCDEPASIRDSLAARGVPASRIVLDYDGTRTIRSIVKAQRVYGVDSVTLISQKFHNERAIYLADRYGIKAIGYNAAPSPNVWLRIKNIARESLARVKMMLEAISGRTPEF